MNGENQGGVNLENVDQLVAKLTTAGSRADFIRILVVLLSLFLVGLTARPLSFGQEYHLGGLRMQNAQEAVIAAFSVILASLSIHLSVLFQRGHELRRALLRLYRERGFIKWSIDPLDCTPFEVPLFAHPSFFHQNPEQPLIVRAKYYLAALLMLFQVCLLPLIAQFFATFKVYNEPRSPLWLLISCSVSALIFPLYTTVRALTKNN